MGEGTIGGQQVFYNPERKVLRLTIKEPFYFAWRELDWPDHVPGIGINREIISFMKKTKCHLIVHVDSEQRDFWLDYDKIDQFMRFNKTDYQTPKGVWVTVLSTNIMPGFAKKIEV